MELRIFVEPQQGATYDDQLAVARLAEELGFGAFFRSDHYLAMGVDGRPGPTDSWVTLAGIARETEHDPARHDDDVGDLPLSRAARDLGRAGRPDERRAGRARHRRGLVRRRARGVRHPVPARPASASTASRTSWRSSPGCGRRPRARRSPTQGSRHSVTDSPGLPKPAQQPHPPIIIGGKGAKRTPALTARYAASSTCRSSAWSVTGQQIGRVRAACEEIGRDPDELVYSNALTVCCGADEAEVKRRAEFIGRTPDDLRANALAGTPQEIVDTIGRYAALGAQRVYLQVLDLHDLDQLRLLADRGHAARLNTIRSARWRRDDRYRAHPPNGHEPHG